MSAQRTRSSSPAKSSPRSGAQTRPAAPSRSSRSRTAVIAVVALLLGAGGALGVTAIVDRPDEAESAVAAAQEAQAQRDVETTRELTVIAREVAALLEPALVGLAGAIPSQEPATPAPVASAEEVDEWSSAVDEARAAFGDSRSAGTAVNVARNSLIAAVEQFQVTVSIYEAALAAEGVQQQRLIEIAGAQRKSAVYTWSIAATQLDLINVEADLGHAHVVLPGAPGSGDFLDGAPEGSH